MENSTIGRSSLWIGVASLFILCSSPLSAQTVLAPGDLFFTGYNSRPAVNNSNFSFVLLRTVTSGTSIRFTDKGWFNNLPGEGFLSDANSNQDGVIRWDAPAAGVTCGTEIRIRAEWNTQLDATVGTVTGEVVATGAALDAGQASNYISLNGAGDQIFAFQGTVVAPTLLAGLDINGGWVATTSATVSSVQSAQPTALGAGNTLTITPEVDNGIYNCPTAPTSNTKANLYSSLRTLANWTGANDPTTFTLPTGCTWTVTDCVVLAPELQLELQPGGTYPIFQLALPQAGVASVQLQRSPDGIHYDVLNEWNHATQSSILQATDAAPLQGTGYYRMAVQFSGGESEVSNTVAWSSAESRALQLAPSVSSGTFFLYGCEEAREIDLYIYDTGGRVVHTQKIATASSGMPVDLAQLSPGLYFYEIADGRRLAHGKLILCY